MFGSKRNQPRRRQAGNGSQPQDKRPNVFSYRASRSGAADNLGRGKVRLAEAPTPRPSIKKHRFKRFVVFAAFLVFLLVVGNNMLLDSANPNIVVINPNNSYRNSDAYSEAAAKAFSSSPFNTNKVTVNVNKIEEQLRQEFPELADVSVTLPVIGRKPTVNFEPSLSRLILQAASGEAFVLDENGRATTSGEIVAKYREANLPEVKDQSQVTVKLGQVAIPSTSVTYITEVVQQLKAKQIEVTEMTLIDTPSELHIRIKDQGYYIKFNTRGDARVAVGSFLALKAHIESQSKKVNEYIDVRIENRAYYK